MEKTMEFTGTLVVVTCWCGIVYAEPRDLRHYQLRQQENGEKVMATYCPLGHGGVPTGPTRAQRNAERERAMREASDARATALTDQLQAEKRQHAATKGKVTKMRKRIAAGVCPCCNRSFTQVRRHMETQHPDEAALVFNAR